MQPVIGITVSTASNNDQYVVHQAHVQAIERAGGIPFLLPYVTNHEMMLKVAEMIDGLYLTGGGDIDPIFFDEEPEKKLGKVDPLRDQFEITLTKQLLLLNKPIFAVCRGSQIINVAAGGTLYQHIYSHIDSQLEHVQTAPIDCPYHYVSIESNSKLYDIIGKTKIRVNSNHHQANRKIGHGLLASAHANDLVVEAIESTIHSFVIGVQWHPEQLLTHSDEAAKKLYDAFIQACIVKH